MPVTIGEVSTTIETQPSGGAVESGAGGQAQEEGAYEVRLEELRDLVRALVAEELERQLRRRIDCP